MISGRGRHSTTPGNTQKIATIEKPIADECTRRPMRYSPAAVMTSSTAFITRTAVTSAEASCDSGLPSRSVCEVIAAGTSSPAPSAPARSAAPACSTYSSGERLSEPLTSP